MRKQYNRLYYLPTDNRIIDRIQNDSNITVTKKERMTWNGIPVVGLYMEFEDLEGDDRDPEFFNAKHVFDADGKLDLKASEANNIECIDPYDTDVPLIENTEEDEDRAF